MIFPPVFPHTALLSCEPSRFPTSVWAPWIWLGDIISWALWSLNDFDWSTRALPCFMKGAVMLYDNVLESMSRPVMVSGTVTGLRIGGLVVVVVGGGGGGYQHDIHTQLSETHYIQHMQPFGMKVGSPHTRSWTQSHIQVQYANN